MQQTSAFSALSHGSSGLLFSLAFVLVPLWVAMLREGAPVARLLRSFIVGPILLLIVGLVMGLVAVAQRSIGVEPGVLHWLIGSVLSGVLGYRVGLYIAQQNDSSGLHRRGAVVSDGDGTQSQRPLDAESPVLSLAGRPVAMVDETKHFKIIGTTGTGKSTAIRELLKGALARGDRAVIADPDGGYLRDFYSAERGDVILNPFAPHSLKWDLMGEIDRDPDVDQLARSLIPDASTDRPWGDYARTLFTAVIQQARRGNIRDDVEIYRLLTSAPAEELRLLLAGTPAGPFLEQANDRMFGSVRSVTSSAIRVLKYTAAQRAPAFSVRQWVRQQAGRPSNGRGGVLFLPYKAGEIAALRSMISAWMRIAIFEAMDVGEGDHHLWFVVDELDALGEIDGLKDALTRLRKFGGRCILGFQSISQVSSTYGKGAADTVVENCGNTLILRCSASEQGGTSQFASRLIGQREVVHIARSKTQQPGNWLASHTTSEHVAIEPAVMASEIERLADLQGYLKFASHPDWQRVELTYIHYPPAEPPRAPAGVVEEPAVAPTVTANSDKTTPVSAPAARKLGRPPGRKAAAKAPSQINPSVADASAELTVPGPNKKGQ